MKQAVPVLCALVCVVALASCTGDDEPGAAHSVARDSAGIVIVENARAAWEHGAEWRLSAQPAVTIGEADGRRRLAECGVA